MTSDVLRVLLEIGTKERRIVAAATDWPGLDRWGRDEDDALGKLSAYLPRYSGVAERTAHHVMDHAWELEDRDLRANEG